MPATELIFIVNVHAFNNDVGDEDKANVKQVGWELGEMVSGERSTFVCTVKF